MHAFPMTLRSFYYKLGLHPGLRTRAVGIGITTGSSSYSLGRMVMIGCDSHRTPARSIKRSGCSLNLFGAGP